jgi:hypothetical protein
MQQPSVAEARWPELTLSALLEQQKILRDEANEARDTLCDAQRRLSMDDEGLNDLRMHLAYSESANAKMDACVGAVNARLRVLSMTEVLQNERDVGDDERLAKGYQLEWRKRLRDIDWAIHGYSRYLQTHNDAFEHGYEETVHPAWMLQELDEWLAFFAGAEQVYTGDQIFLMVDMHRLRERLLHIMERMHAYEARRDEAFMMAAHPRLGSGRLHGLDPGILQRITELTRL